MLSFKRVFYFIISTMILFVLISLNNVYSQNSDFDYIVENDIITIIKYKGSATTLKIPEKIDNKFVKKIRENAFAYNETLTQIELPRSVNFINSSAFYNMNMLENISFYGGSSPNEKLNISDYAFANCPKLTKNSAENILKENLEPHLKSIFVWDKNINGNIKIPNYIERMDASFYGTSIEELSFEDGKMTKLGEDGKLGSFQNCNLLKKVTLSPNIVSFGNNPVFNNCSNLEYFEFKNINPIPMPNSQTFSQIKPNCKFVIPFGSDINKWRKQIISAGAPDTVIVEVKNGNSIGKLYSVNIVNGKAKPNLAMPGETISIEADNIKGKIFNKWSSKNNISFNHIYSPKTTFIMPAENVNIEANYSDIDSSLALSYIKPYVKSYSGPWTNKDLNPYFDSQIMYYELKVSNQYDEIYFDLATKIKGQYVTATLNSKPILITKDGSKFKTESKIVENDMIFVFTLVSANNIPIENYTVRVNKGFSYTVKFDTDGGNYIPDISVNEFDFVPKPKEPEKKGYKFVEWRLDNVKYDFNTPVNRDITLKAIWKKDIKYKAIEVIFKIGDRKYTVIEDGEEKHKIMDVAPFIKSSRTMIPVRYAAETLGLDVDWNPYTRTVIMTEKGKEILIPVDTNKIIINGKTHISDVRPTIEKSRTFLSISNLAKALGLKEGEDIIWNRETREATIMRELEIE